MTDKIFEIIILIISVIVHEFSHGYSAYLLGDDTARLSGRLTLNPLKHLDPLGSVIIPIFLIITSANFIIGWAKPVPYNPTNLRKGRFGDFIVSFAGIFSNILIAVIFGLFIRLAPNIGIPIYTSTLSIHPLYIISSIIVQINLILALFNLIPIPPLDGSKILFAFLPARFRFIENFLERWGIFLLLIFIVFVWKFISPLIFVAFSFLTGL
ncbi:MAG TPA: site-2 protease family protein [Candidatus Paceibacterota bacterium]|nr:site-2 protease family protein [Candidatus Paceibacterota bacterium]